MGTAEIGRDFNVDDLVAQIGGMNIMAISGGRIIIDGATYDPLYKTTQEVELPVGYGYRVRVNLDWDDTWKVSRIFVRKGKVTVKGVQTGVFFDEVGNVCYKASCFQNVEFGEKVSA